MKYSLLFILFASTITSAQLQRYDNFAATTTSASGIGNITQVIPNATLQVFNYPGAGVSCSGGGCTAATTYTNRTGATPCGGGLPLTRPTATTCIGTADASGNFGFWAFAGQYQYCISGLSFTTQCYNVVLGSPFDINNTVANVDAVNHAGWAGTTADAWINAAINSIVNGKVFIGSGTYNLSAPIVMKRGIRIECTNNQAVNFVPSVSMTTVFQFGDGTTGVQYGGIENCGITLTAAGQHAVQLKGSTAASTSPSQKNLFRKNFITGASFANTVAFSLDANAYTNRFEDNETVNLQTPYQFPCSNFSCENNVIFGEVIGCNITGGAGILVNAVSGPLEVYVTGGDIVGCPIGISVTTNQGIVHVGGGVHMEQNLTDISCSGNTAGGFINGINTTSVVAGVLGQSAHSIQFVGCQNWDVRNVRNSGTYTADQLNLDATSFSNTFQGYNPAAATVVMAAGANNTFISGTQGRFEGIGGTFRSYRAANLLTQYVELDGTGGNARINTGAGFSTFDFAENGTNVLEYGATGFYPLTVNNTTLGTAALPWKSFNLGTAATNNFVFTPAATAAARTVSIPDPGTNVNLAFDLTATSSAFATATTAGTCVQNTTAVTGAATTMAVAVSPASTPGVGAVWSAFVSSAGNVTINECAVATSAGGTIAFNIRVIP